MGRFGDMVHTGNTSVSCTLLRGAGKSLTRTLRRWLWGRSLPLEFEPLPKYVIPSPTTLRILTRLTIAPGHSYLTARSINYSGNRDLNLEHQRQIRFSYTDRVDIETEFVGGLLFA
jgi:hypothetical protein